ncbi:MAG: hypothetical protein K9N05_00925 [Candidatus Marinimicrobia bacterium]|nr:hypothetical protein [Candidatus Neomarinimicrobiota bacterium]
MKNSSHVLNICKRIFILTFLSTICLFAYNEKAFVNSRLDLVKLDTLNFNSIYLPAELKTDFPFDITGSRAIKDAYKDALDRSDGYKIYELAILEFDKVFTYGNLLPYKMLNEAFDIAMKTGDPRLGIYVMSFELSFNLFGWGNGGRESCYRQLDSLATLKKDATVLFEMANYLEYMGHENPSPKKLRAKAYGFEDPVNIRQEEFEVYWDDLKTCIKNSDKQVFDLYIAPTVTYQQADFGDIYNERDYSKDELLNDLDKNNTGPGLLPAWTEPMDSAAIGKPVQHRLGEYGVYYWVLGREYYNPDREFIYKVGKSGPVSYETVYYFKKIDGNIRLYKILYEDM